MSLPADAKPTAEELIAEVLQMRETSPIPKPVLDIAARGEITQAHLKSLVVVELMNHEPELAAYGVLLTRFPRNPAAGYFGRLASMVYQATPRLHDTIARMNITPEQVRTWPVALPCYAYAGIMSWIALHGSLAGAALAAWIDVDAYYAGTFELVDHIERTGTPAPKPFAVYYRNGRPDEWKRSAVTVIQHGLDSGDDPLEALRCGRLMDECVGEFFRAVTLVTP